MCVEVRCQKSRVVARRELELEQLVAEFKAKEIKAKETSPSPSPSHRKEEHRACVLS